MRLKDNYYFNAFFWNTIQKILNAIVGFISVPLLLTFFGVENYGVLSLATACNGYMHLLDLGMNTGAVRYYSIWISEKNQDLINRVARTNVSFYGVIAIINIILLLFIAFFGETWFSTTHDQFLQLRSCLFIISFFCLLNWETTTYSQLLIANKQLAYTAKMQTLLSLFKLVLIGVVFYFHLSLSAYFFLFQLLLSSLIFPYAIKCIRSGYVDSVKPAFYWTDFKVVFTFSLSIFALSLFQMTATQSRPIILALFSQAGPTINTEFKIIEVVPQLIIMIGGTFSSIFLPKTSEMVIKADQAEIEHFAYKWTRITTAIVCALCFPFILCSKEVISAYVGSQYSYLAVWLVVWCVTVLIQMHTTPGNALVLAYGKTKTLVIVTALVCILSIFINALLSKRFGVGSAVISYFIYVVCIIGLYYLHFYKSLLRLNRWKMIKSFLFPVLIAVCVALFVRSIPLTRDILPMLNDRIAYVVLCVIKSLIWMVPYLLLLTVFKQIDWKQIRR